MNVFDLGQRNDLTDSISTFKVIQCNMFWSRSCQGQTNAAKYIYCHIP